ncbi:fluoride efflux transporter CrcB [Caproicibacterium argilliputei]|uniref:Fluoride-specific ion channel FluC n=1 Tax=Caproicibacterium argilliputei TaxID=3030016 RepID=A0AA97D815_9FIRM|nr:fluoride efflux transporter CrcB [Caproicibacterium argilliputei]WOC31374.1 fluoride efflux transporter CrcB [Caproicibacterium argilliputei]
MEKVVQACLLVAAGGALGAVGRYLCGLIPLPVEFPLMTMLINFLGAVLIGFVTTVPNLSANAALFLKTGVCGGFTTFSTFSLDTVNLLQGGRPLLGVLNASVSVGVCLIGVLLGSALGRAAYAAAG